MILSYFIFSENEKGLGRKKIRKVSTYLNLKGSKPFVIKMILNSKQREEMSKCLSSFGNEADASISFPVVVRYLWKKSKMKKTHH